MISFCLFPNPLLEASLTKTLTVTGAGDDLLLEGAVDAELLCTDPDGVRLTFSDGTILRARPGDGWRITHEREGDATVEIDRAPVSGLDRDDTDRATLDGYLFWVLVDGAEDLPSNHRINL
jgi:hypothetical protein